MPELPEVEIARRNLIRWFDQQKVVGAEAEKSRIFRGGEPARFEKIRGRLESLDRRGKYLMFTFEGRQGLLAHLGMTGKWVRRPAGVEEKYSRARFLHASGEVIHFRDPRMFGRIEPAAAAQLRKLEAVAKLGRDPLTDGLSPADLQEAIGDSRQELKVALMDQERIAGLGNIHAAEALFRAKLHPGRAPASLSPAEWKALALGIHDALKFALDQQEDDEIEYVEEPGADNPFLIYGRAGEPCGKCKTQVESFPQGGRTTHFCPKCQPKKGKAKR
jgi:formamidopyrimidine-DNA glycosylase